MAQKLAAKNSKDQPSTTLKREAIDSSGSIGSFYDARVEHVLGKINLKVDEKLNKSLQTIKCIFHSNSKNQSSNLLQLTNMSPELRLNILLDITPRNGIAVVIHYPHPINKDTRALHYTFLHRQERISDKAIELRRNAEPFTPSAATTHIITDVTYGIDIVIVLQLSSEDNVVKNIDRVLQRMCSFLNDDKEWMIDVHEENLLEQIIDPMVYSNIPDFTKSITLRNIYEYIAENKNKKEYIDTPVIYTLQSIEYMLPQNKIKKGSQANFISFPLKLIHRIEDSLMQLSHTLQNFKQSLDIHIPRLLCGNLEKQLREAQHHWLLLSKEQDSVIKQLKQMVIDIHRGHTDICMLDGTINKKDHATLCKLNDQVIEEVNDLEAKGRLITSLQKQHFEYCNALECNVSKSDNEETLVRKLRARKQTNDRILCSNDKLNKIKKYQRELNQLRDQLANECETNRELRLIYADFSYCHYPLTDVMILKVNNQKKPKDINKPRTYIFSRTNKPSTTSWTTTKTSFPLPTSKKITIPPSPEKKIPSSPLIPDSTSTTEEFINILLLGESGVGKSTFINAFVNYLTFETFERAQSGKPVVLMPVSFLMTTGHNFEEHTVTFGDFDSSNNEDFDHPGESVTQHCKSYEFDLSREDGRKLRIVDTPGFGDTRGLDQDDLNMQHILEYVNNLRHVNAVCFLLKPNASQLNIFFRACLTQLLDLLGPDACQNIIFCFTNARSTFYTPGDTAPLLKTMLKSFPTNDIPFRKTNTFCFDNESFRYLVALQNEIQFDTDETKEYQMSWSTSVKESSRLIDYISNDLTECHLHDEHQSIKHAQVEIIHMIRPMLEEIRNILRNLILCKMNMLNKSIKLCPKLIHRPTTICLSCKPYSIEIGNFWIVREITHEFLRKCLVCPCSIDEHIPITYVLNYEYVNSPAKYCQNEMIDIVHQICLAGAEFDYFLLQVPGSLKKEPFWMGLVLMIHEETELCQNRQTNNPNVQLLKDLREFKCEYEEQIEKLKSKQKPIELRVIYQWITMIREYPMIHEQLEAIRQSQQMRTEPYEIPDE